MRFQAAVLCMILAGCNTPGPGFRGIEPVRVSIGQSRFDVRVDGTRAQAIRVNPEWAPRFSSVASRGAAAMAKASGCRVARIRGDQAVMQADLDCGQGVPPAQGEEVYDCEVDHIHARSAELICTPRL